MITKCSPNVSLSRANFAALQSSRPDPVKLIGKNGLV